MDWRMPGMDGGATTSALKERFGPEDSPPVILVTAYGREEAIQETQEADLSGILVKPVSPSTLLDCMLNALGKQVFKPVGVTDRKEDQIEAVRRLRGACILLVEDNEINQELALELLRDAGIVVKVADNGRQALDILKQEHFDGVLMDIQMPVMDGYSATREIRKQKRYEGLPVIAMTANAMAGDREKVLEAGMNDHIAKPINLRDMFATMAKWISPADSLEERNIEAAKEDTGVDTIPQFNGIDTNAGLARTQGNRRLYLKLLRMFRDGQRDFVIQFRHAQRSDDPQGPTRAAHTLKGVAANIGAEEVRDAAKELEAACREGKSEDDVDELLTQVEKSLLPVITALDGLVEETRVSHPPTDHIDQDALRPLLEGLRDRLEEFDGGALKFVEQIRERLQGTEQEERLRRLEKLVDNFEFQEALAIVDELAQSLDSSQSLTA
jgi:polar amino acid transport system substrate-binding protein